MAVPEPHHNRVAIAALFVVIIVATMLISVATSDRGHRQDRDSGESSGGEVAAASTVSCADPVSVEAPQPDFAAVVAGHNPGTCFFLQPGTYRFHDVVPKDGMVFVGESTDAVVLDGDGFENAFHGTADAVTIAQMTFRGFNSSGGTSRQEQAPIRGTAALWASDRGSMATNWLVTDVVSSNNYASGIFLGEHWTVRNSRFHTNGVAGIGGDHLVGGLIESNIIYDNGAQQAQGALVNGGGLKITQAGTPGAPVVVRNNEFYGNQKIAIWCDIGCDGFHVIDNYIHDHVSRGVMFELSSNLVVRGNTILRSNTWTDFGGDFNAGAVTVGESRDALIENNVIDDARAGVVIRQTNRPAAGEGFLSGYPYVNYVSGHVTVRNNIVTNTQNMGISTGTTGSGQITQPETIVFTGNSYGAPGEMSFWLNDGAAVGFSQWQQSGRDVTAEGSQASSPTNQPRGPQGGASIGTTTTTTTTPPATETPATPTTVAQPTPTEPSTVEPPSATEPSTTEKSRAEAPSTTEVIEAAVTPSTTEAMETTEVAETTKLTIAIDPATTEPSPTQPARTEPSPTQPATTESSRTQPAAADASGTATSPTTGHRFGNGRPASARRAGPWRPASPLGAENRGRKTSRVPTEQGDDRIWLVGALHAERLDNPAIAQPGSVTNVRPREEVLAQRDRATASETVAATSPPGSETASRGLGSSEALADRSNLPVEVHADGLETLGLPPPAPSAASPDSRAATGDIAPVLGALLAGLAVIGTTLMARRRAVRLPVRRR